MKRLLMAFGLCLSTSVAALPALAQTPAGGTVVTAGSLEISGRFARATLPNAPVGGAYMTITNTGTTDDRLLGVTSTAGDVSLHAMTMSDGAMRMQSLPNGIPIPAGETVTLSPSGLHMMIGPLTSAFVLGETLELTATFEEAGSVPLAFDILALNARSYPEVDHPQ